MGAKIKLYSAYFPGSPTQPYYLCYDPTQASNQVWAGPEGRGGWSDIWYAAPYKGQGDGPWFFSSQDGGNWRLCNIGNQLGMRPASYDDYAAMWWIEQYKDPSGGVFGRLKSAAQNNLYVALSLSSGVPDPDNLPCRLTDICSKIDEQKDWEWYPQLPGGQSGAGLAFPPPQAG